MSSTTKLLSGGAGNWLAYFSNDIVILITIFVLFCLYGMYFGKSRMISLILAFYPAQLLYSMFPFFDKALFMKGDNLLLLNKVLIFIIFWIILDILINRYIFSESFGDTGYLKIAGYALAGTIVLLLFTYSVISLDLVHNFSSSIDVLFTGEDRIFFWNLAPLALLFVL